MTGHPSPADAAEPDGPSGAQRGEGKTASRQVVAPKIRFPQPVYGTLRGLAHLVNRGYWRVTVSGARVPRSGPVILAPVHRSFIDFFVVSEVTRRPIFYMAKDELWESRPLAAFLDASGSFPVRREGADRRSTALAQAVLEDGETLVVFPEGTRREGPLITDLHEGVAFLSARTGASVVPVGIGGTSESLPKGSKVPRPVPVRLVVGEAIPPPPSAGKGRVPRRELRELTEKLREELQHLYDEARSQAAQARHTRGSRVS